MIVSGKTIAIVSASALLIGLLIGYLPMHSDNSSLAEQNKHLQENLSASQNELSLSDFAVRSANVYTEAAKSNFSVASGSASSFFTDLRKYIDQSNDAALNKQLEEVMTSRDGIIAGLAKADPTVTPKLQEVFVKMEQIHTASQSKH